MENFEKLNVSQICSVESYLKRRNNRFEYKNKSRFLFFWENKEGFYYKSPFGDESFITKEEIEKSGEFYCEGKNVYYKPYIRIIMSNEHVWEKQFESKEQLFEFMESEKMKGVVWIEL